MNLKHLVIVLTDIRIPIIPVNADPNIIAIYSIARFKLLQVRALFFLLFKSLLQCQFRHLCFFIHTRSEIMLQAQSCFALTLSPANSLRCQCDCVIYWILAFERLNVMRITKSLRILATVARADHTKTQILVIKLGL